MRPLCAFTTRTVRPAAGATEPGGAEAPGVAGAGVPGRLAGAVVRAGAPGVDGGVTGVPLRPGAGLGMTAGAEEVVEWSGAGRSGTGPYCPGGGASSGLWLAVLADPGAGQSTGAAHAAVVSANVSTAMRGNRRRDARRGARCEMIGGRSGNSASSVDQSVSAAALVRPEALDDSGNRRTAP
ncbi:hypothetical protein ACFFX1_14255 [Dactylosporangium sucinum]|uniref:hypothetical protein n=1 Tax=Dactylosporangium sucinum TaxID=1424081 RepID=UPI00167D40F4|nr:hypothetical protein [Dactylosporangium sucinum]